MTLPSSRRRVLAVLLLVASAVGILIVPATALQIEGTTSIGRDFPTTSGLGVSNDSMTSLFGFGHGDPFGVVTSQGAWGLVESLSDLSSVDILSGTLLPRDVHQVGGDGLSQMAALNDAGKMAVNALAVAEEARRRKEAARLKAGIVLKSQPNPGLPEDWEMSNFSACGSSNNTKYKARTETVILFEQMCQVAASEGVALGITSAYRSPDHQTRLFKEATAKYGSPEAASKWVARPAADGSCTSKHCAGIAIDVTGGGPAWEWMGAHVGCMTSDGVFTSTDSAGGCPSGSKPIERVQTFGLIRPMTWEPWHIEVGVPIVEAAQTSSCTPDATLSAPSVVASVFRCALEASGYSLERTQRVTAEALLISKCESDWRPDLVAFGGRYVSTPHPETGFLYTATGLFQLTRTTADRWVSGGWDNAQSAKANAEGAAKLWISGDQSGNDGWSPWSCAGNGQSTSALPGRPGGPSNFPSWVWDY